jgi:hypothetical protein
VQRILNSYHSDRLKISASQLLFGNVLNLDRGIFLPAAERLLVESKPLSGHMSQMLKMQYNLLKASAAELLRTDLLHVSTKQQRTHTEFPINSYVLVHYRSGSAPTRLHSSWRGPRRVVSRSNSSYTLYDLITNKEKEYHVSDMKQFLYDPDDVDPVDVARRDHMEFFVASIISHRRKYQLSVLRRSSKGNSLLWSFSSALPIFINVIGVIPIAQLGLLHLDCSCTFVQLRRLMTPIRSQAIIAFTGICYSALIIHHKIT